MAVPLHIPTMSPPVSSVDKGEAARPRNEPSGGPRGQVHAHLPGFQLAPLFPFPSSQDPLLKRLGLDLPASWEETSSQKRLKPHHDLLPSECGPRGPELGVAVFLPHPPPSALSSAWPSSASALFLVNTYVNLPLPPDSQPHDFARRPLSWLLIWQVAPASSVPDVAGPPPPGCGENPGLGAPGAGRQFCPHLIRLTPSYLSNRRRGGKAPLTKASSIDPSRGGGRQRRQDDLRAAVEGAEAQGG
ncbi:uncharacterized protein LOC116664809 [Camelus ferus]|uniref:Uncharacterized protein LOC116664809 n=1 Tax=Camelus ferus TaxID=419612 RepID=A0A8B8TBR9_CAMFR|nr:uncharacterized protein LOC116664809 [Camelus ferus]